MLAASVALLLYASLCRVLLSPATCFAYGALLLNRLAVGLRLGGMLYVSSKIRLEDARRGTPHQLEQFTSRLTHVWWANPALMSIETITLFLANPHANLYPALLSCIATALLLVLHPKIQRPVFEVKHWGARRSLLAEVARKLFSAMLVYTALTSADPPLCLPWALLQLGVMLLVMVGMQPHLGAARLPRAYAALQRVRYLHLAFLATLALECWGTYALQLSHPLLVQPPPPRARGGEALLLFIPGAGVPPSHYAPLLSAIQRAAAAQPRPTRLWTATLAPPGPCIFSTLAAAAPLRRQLSRAAAQARAQGYASSSSAAGAPRLLLGGHSQGGACAALAALSARPPYDALLLLASFPPNHAAADLPLPTLTIGAELNGGLARPSLLLRSLAASDAEAARRRDGRAWQLAHAPLVVLPGLSHASFCPQSELPGDLRPEVSGEAAARLVGEAAGAFLGLLASRDAAGRGAGRPRALLARRMRWTRALLAPLREALRLEGGGGATHWCAEAQRALLGGRHARRLRVAVERAASRRGFMRTRAEAARGGAGRVEVVVGALEEEAADTIPLLLKSCITPAAAVACKLVSAEALAARLGLAESEYAAGRTCRRDINAHAVRTAERILSSSKAGRAILRRFRERGRPLRLDNDTSFWTGPSFVFGGKLRLTSEDGAEACASDALGPRPLDALWKPGVHYCKLLSPARAMVYMMTDALKPRSACLGA
ncbi:hypothetical protein AB1Y20_005606 [Prymnesium parvum]|uniref:GPI inositol-deacylase n=1 Tax=Prymnesium parvum TaxID=97485 RepID=A0AB34J717_PRYPA